MIFRRHGFKVSVSQPAVVYYAPLDRGDRTSAKEADAGLDVTILIINGYITMNSSNQKLSVIEKVGYSLGDFAANLVFQTLVTYLLFFYTDVYKLSNSAASYVIGICGFIGGVAFAPIMGAIADRTNTRWGKYRPWIIWTSVPFGITILLAFTTPDFGHSGKIAYAAITYLMLVTLYTANNLPYASLSGVLTGDMAERNSLSAYRFVAVMVAQFIIQGLMLPIILMAGDGDKAVGFEKVMTVFAYAGVLCFVVTFLTTKERVVATEENTGSITDDIKDLFHNVPWIIMLAVVVLVFVGLILKASMYIFYFENYVDPAALDTFLENSGFNGMIASITAGAASMGWTFEWPDDPAASGFGIFNGLSIIMMIVGIGFSKMLADRFGKRNIYSIFLAISALFILAFLWIPPTSVNAMYISNTLHGFFYGISIPIMWAMIADVADYSEWKNFRRATAIIFSAMLLGLKAGITIGGSVGGFILAIYGYDAALDSQSEDAKLGIKLSVSLFPTIAFLVAAGSLFFYEINKKMESEIEHDLAARRTPANA